MQHPGKVLTRSFLMREVWETDFTGDTRTLDVHICWLRRKLGESADEPHHIQTIRGVGYLFDPH
jgi:DNA-binding response OmpR family regulator